MIIRRKDGRISTCSAEIIAAESAALAFALRSRDKGGHDHVRVLRLEGAWQADDRNRLSFVVNDNRADGVLVFRNCWTVDDNQEIVYEYERRSSGSRHRFRLEGHWLVSSDESITYALGRGNYGPEFKCQLESVSLRPKKGCVKFRIGTGVAQKRKALVATVYGSWRFDGKYALDFNAGSDGRIEIDLSRALKRANGALFLRLLKSGDDKRIEAGITIPF